MKTMICLILDRSGSMAGHQSDVVGGVNSFIDEQKKLPDPATIALVRFDSWGVERFRPMGPLAETQHIISTDFQPRGGTPLLDAVGKTIVALDEDWKREQPERAICVIVTDGQENESREYKKDQIKQMIQARQDSGKWAFIYLGAGVDAFHEAGSMGLASANTAGYKNTAAGTRAVYAAASNSVSNMRTTGATLATNLGGNIEEDGSLLNKVHGTAQKTPSQPWTAPNTSAEWTPPA